MTRNGQAQGGGLCKLKSRSSHSTGSSTSIRSRSLRGQVPRVRIFGRGIALLFVEFEDESEEGLAERVGFEPTVLVKVHTLSKRAP
jgi:hypothetical protein